jgi:MOSC domain-containing protein YiiM
LAIGEAVVEVTDQPHTGCAKFTQRFGLPAFRWVNTEAGMKLRLRGMNARVVQGGTIRPGDSVEKLPA